jgi:CHAT domain-containing protein/tetratricopeptide (TPR) repeat protein
VFGHQIPRALAAVLVLTTCLAPARAQEPSDLKKLKSEIFQLDISGKLAEAAAIREQALALVDRELGGDHPEASRIVTELIVHYGREGVLPQLERLYKRRIATSARLPQFDDASIEEDLRALAGVYWDQGRLVEAEPLVRRALELAERRGNPIEPSVGAVRSELATLLIAQERLDEAELLLKRNLSNSQARGRGVADSLAELAYLYARQGRDAEAEAMYKRSIDGMEDVIKRLGPGTFSAPETISLALKLHSLGLLYNAQGRYAEAEKPLQRSLALIERWEGSESRPIRLRLEALGQSYLAQGRLAEAEPLIRRALAMATNVAGPDNLDIAALRGRLAELHFAREDWKQAASDWGLSSELLIRLSRRDADVLGKTTGGQNVPATQRHVRSFLGLVKASHLLVERVPADYAKTAAAMFVTAQWAQYSEAALSVAQMAVRQAKDNTALSAIVRERQDLLSEWQSRDKLLVGARAAPPENRSARAESSLGSRLGEIDRRIAEIDATIAREFPDYTALVNPEPLAVADVQTLLREDEALVLFLDTPALSPRPAELFAWVVTKEEVRWTGLEIPQRALSNRLFALRCGLDAVAWNTGAERCARLLGIAAADADARSLPYDLTIAHDIYRALFGPIEETIRDKHLLIVSSGTLAALPFSALVTQEPPVAIPKDYAGYAAATWLAKKNAISVLPAVSSLRALRQFAKQSRARHPFIGFGNPLLVGPDGADRRAWERQSCSQVSVGARTTSRGIRGAMPRFFRGGLADVEQVRTQYPLPETADELCAVAQSVGARDGAVYLGEKANEGILKALSADGVLASARVVHFATHGLLADQAEILTAAKVEPALLLTPPANATEENDGLLTASEIARLKLDADWVVLSACNTAAGSTDKAGAEALSGLARAFFYAGARAVLASHWAVNSDATVMLITKAFAELRSDARIGRAEAMRRSMLALIASSGGNSHPANWAPFVVVGEGAR